MLGKLLAIADIGQRVYSRWLLRRMLSSAIIIVGLTITASITAGAVIISTLYAAYLALIRSGRDPQFAFLLVDGLGALTALLLIVLAAMGLRYLCTAPRKAFQKFPAARNANEIVEAFLEGFMRPPAE